MMTCIVTRTKQYVRAAIVTETLESMDVYGYECLPALPGVATVQTNDGTAAFKAIVEK